MTPPDGDDEGGDRLEDALWAYRRILEPHHDALRDLQTNLHAPHDNPLPEPLESELEAALDDAVQALDAALRTLTPPD